LLANSEPFGDQVFKTAKADKVFVIDFENL